jgi:tyrosine-protein phosphatase non-receptor type 9
MINSIDLFFNLKYINKRWKFYSFSYWILIFTISKSQKLFYFTASPVAPSSASSGFSDDDSLHCENGGGISLEEFVEQVRSKGRNGLTAEYSEIKARPPDGTFTLSKY